MRIVYSPYYDGETFLGESPRTFGVAYVGNLGLLEQLQLRAGLHVSVLSDVEREAVYYNALMKNVKNTLFEKAVDVDPFGVAKKLLRWRDALVMAGWNAEELQDPNCKVSVLARIEEDFNAQGRADAWRMICEAYEKGCTTDIEQVQVDCPWSEVPLLIQKTLQAMGQKGTEIVRSVDEEQEAPALNIDKIKLLDFNDVNDAYEWFAQIEKLPENSVVVNRDNVQLNHTLFTWNRPLVQSWLNDSNPQLLQLFKLCMSIFSRPLNIQNLVSYLMLPMSPIPSKLRHDLANLLIDKGGFGDKKLCDDGKERDKWEEIIETFEWLGKDDNDSPQQAKDRKMPFLSPIRKDYSGSIEKAEIIDYVTKLKEWIRGHYADKNLPDEKKAQFHELNLYLTSFSTALQSEEEKVDFDEIEKLIMQVYRPMNYSLQDAEASSNNVVNDICSVANDADWLIWLDCQEEDREQDQYDFLSTKEREELTKMGCEIPDFERHLETVRKERLRLLNKCEHILLVQSHFNGTTRLGEHPVVAEARFTFKKAEKKLEPTDKKNLEFEMLKTTEETNKIEVLTPVKALELDEIDYQGRKESNTSIDTLINFPFDYVMEYVAKLHAPQDEQLQDTSIIIGQVAHYFFEHITKDANNDLKKMRELVEDEFDKRLEEAIDATGLILRLQQNASELVSFRRQLKESILAFIDIMEKKLWTPVGCEISLPEKEDDALKLDKIGCFGARIDCLLKEGEKFVVVDFKWSQNKRFSKKLENNIAIQLELYKQAVLETYPGKEVVGVGYYLMPKKQLITTNIEEIPQSRFIQKIEPKNNAELFPQIQNSFKFRMAEIKRGHIEEGEMMDFLGDDESYYGKTIVEGLVPLKVKEETEGSGKNKITTAILKESQYVFKPSKKRTFEDDKLEPSEKATTHPILKGRLK